MSNGTDEFERELDLLGLVALRDPLRETSRDAVRAARSAGLRVEILTGDHAVTARSIGRALELPEQFVHARVTPAEKLRLVEQLQSEGEAVAVTGDGANDAPALRRADVAVAMGRSGTEAAREAADLVLTDDDFATIVAAIREGRAIADNIRKFVAVLLSANLGEVSVFTVVIVAGLGVPMTVVQVLLVNVVTDGFPAVALTRDPPSPSTMTRGSEARNPSLPAARLGRARTHRPLRRARRAGGVPGRGGGRGADDGLRYGRSRGARPRLLGALTRSAGHGTLRGTCTSSPALFSRSYLSRWPSTCRPSTSRSAPSR